MAKTKTEKEFEILNRIFKRDDHCKVIKSEMPDFILEYKNTNLGDILIGVEITELYLDGATARLVNMPDYAKKIMDGTYIHKDDKLKLRPQRVTYFGKSNNYQPIKTKILHLPNYTLKDFQNAFLDSLKDKNERLKKYRKDVGQCCLVVYDSFQFMKKRKRENFGADFFTSEVLSAIRKSSYHEIYLVAGFDGSDDEFYIQLKAWDLISESARAGAYLTYPPHLKKLNSLNLSHNEVFAEILLRRGLTNIQRSSVDSTSTVMCNRYELSINDGRAPFFDNFPFLKSGLGLYSLNENRKNYFSSKSFSHYESLWKKLNINTDYGFQALKPKQSDIPPE
ncbi:TPA: hypothetical protein SL372_000414 [Pseudomonas aeruginosa]|nr:hypothetical protein [Pseudomonas aeruginosa]